jgi:hypothetical protein
MQGAMLIFYTYDALLISPFGTGAFFKFLHTLYLKCE